MQLRQPSSRSRSLRGRTWRGCRVCRVRVRAHARVQGQPRMQDTLTMRRSCMAVHERLEVLAASWQPCCSAAVCGWAQASMRARAGTPGTTLPMRTRSSTHPHADVDAMGGCALGHRWASTRLLLLPSWPSNTSGLSLRLQQRSATRNCAVSCCGHRGDSAGARCADAYRCGAAGAHCIMLVDVCACVHTCIAAWAQEAPASAPR
jgi:hypothetical protein